jgi:hypothetical protein
MLRLPLQPDTKSSQASKGDSQQTSSTAGIGNARRKSACGHCGSDCESEYNELDTFHSVLVDYNHFLCQNIDERLDALSIR